MVWTRLNLESRSPQERPGIIWNDRGINNLREYLFINSRLPKTGHIGR
jgi:hypothetical protein